MLVYFHKFSAKFPFEFYHFVPVFDFLTLTDQEQVLKTRWPVDASPQEKLTQGVRLGL